MNPSQPLADHAYDRTFVEAILELSQKSGAGARWVLSIIVLTDLYCLCVALQARDFANWNEARLKGAALVLGISDQSPPGVSLAGENLLLTLSGGRTQAIPLTALTTPDLIKKSLDQSGTTGAGVAVSNEQLVLTLPTKQPRLIQLTALSNPKAIEGALTEPELEFVERTFTIDPLPPFLASVYGKHKPVIEFIRSLSVEGLADHSLAREKMAALLHVREELVNRVPVPPTSLTFDINDIGLMTIYATLCLLIWLFFLYRRWESSMDFLLKVAEKAKVLREVYERLAIQQVLILGPWPKKLYFEESHRDTKRRALVSTLSTVVLWVPLASCLVVFGIDLWTLPKGLLENSEGAIAWTIFEIIGIGLLVLVFKAVLGLHKDLRVDLSRAYDKAYGSAVERLYESDYQPPKLHQASEASASPST